MLLAMRRFVITDVFNILVSSLHAKQYARKGVPFGGIRIDVLRHVYPYESS